jgi:hypothetical protein
MHACVHEIVKEFGVAANVEHHHHHEKGFSVCEVPARRLKPMRTQAETKPQMMAAQGSTTAQPEVMAAKPPSSPLQTSKTLQ